MNGFRPMYLQHARPPGSHLVALALSRRTRARLGRPRCVPSLLVSREAQLHAGDHLPPHHAGRGRMRRGMEPRWTLGRQRRRRWRCQGICQVETGRPRRGGPGLGLAAHTAKARDDEPGQNAARHRGVAVLLALEGTGIKWCNPRSRARGRLLDQKPLHTKLSRTSQRSAWGFETSPGGKRGGGTWPGHWRRGDWKDETNIGESDIRKIPWRARRGRDPREEGCVYDAWARRWGCNSGQHNHISCQDSITIPTYRRPSEKTEGCCVGIGE